MTPCYKKDTGGDRISHTSKKLSEQIFDMRIRAGMSQSQLAHAAGLSVAVVQRYEKDNYTGHKLEILQAIAGATGQKMILDFEPVDNVSFGGSQYRANYINVSRNGKKHFQINQEKEFHDQRCDIRLHRGLREFENERE